MAESGSADVDAVQALFSSRSHKMQKSDIRRKLDVDAPFFAWHKQSQDGGSEVPTTVRRRNANTGGHLLSSGRAVPRNQIHFGQTSDDVLYGRIGDGKAHRGDQILDYYPE